jgi:leucine dehydrogenase
MIENGVKKMRGTSRQHTALDGLFRYAEFLNFGEVHVKFDPATGLKAIVAIHNLKRGPAIGGARLVRYPSADAALEDVLRLAYMMSLKAAMSDLPHGGAKAVLIAPKVIKDRKAYIESFADFVNVLGGRYVTAIDSGTTPQDMDIIAERTSFVTCTTKHGELSDVSFNTALGVLRGIEASVKYKLHRDDLSGIHVAIQGAGHVGYFLARELTKRGAKLTMTDIRPEALQRCIDEFQVAVCLPHEIYDVDAEVFAPCALGSILNSDTIKRLKVQIVAGSANNQLAHHHQNFLMQERGILYAPDFVINAGGLIFAAAMYDHNDLAKAKAHVDRIYQTTMDIYEKASIEKRMTTEIAEEVAISRLK